MASKNFSVVVACCDQLGIGHGGSLPWQLKEDMQFFRKLTTKCANGKQNAVIMGRKTYFSIPEKFRPLKNRVNIVLSRASTLDIPESVYHAKDFNSALDLLGSDSLKESLDRVFVIGGSAIYQEAFQSQHLYRVYLTRIYKSFQCDVFLPKTSLPSFKRVQVDGIPYGLQQDSGTEFEFQVYQRSDHSDDKMSIVAAMSSNRGIGFEGRFPWPHLPTDYEYYNSVISPANCKTPDGVVCLIEGRLSYQEAIERNIRVDKPGFITVVLSSDPSRVPNLSPHLVVPDLAQAIELCRNTKNMESTYLLGGSRVYTEALAVPECSKIYLTEIDKEFPSDTFFPVFERLFTLVSEGKTITENGCSFKFNIYERKSFDELLEC
ncbi:DHFR [Bugula neritina]|uniref:dihydrofolate reductase n=1 Tax=Bugula neritina TaxID=10212 RepID=A0A7J7JG58_BUGNE|nr:DHFR [Bugula neritina]